MEKNVDEQLQQGGEVLIATGFGEAAETGIGDVEITQVIEPMGDESVQIIDEPQDELSRAKILEAQKEILLDAASHSEEDRRLIEERVLSHELASTSGDIHKEVSRNPGTSTLHGLAFSIEEVREEFTRPNDILKKMLAWADSIEYTVRSNNLRGLASLVMNEKTFIFLEEGHGLTIDKHNRLTPTGNAIKLTDLHFSYDTVSEAINTNKDNFFVLSALDEVNFLDILGAKFGMTGKQAEKVTKEKRSKTERVLDKFIADMIVNQDDVDENVQNIMHIRRAAIIEKTSLAEIIAFLIAESKNVIDKRLLLFASTKSDTRCARPINSIVLAFKCEGAIARRTRPGDKLIKRVSIDEKDYLCRMNVAIASIFCGLTISNLEITIEMEVNLTQIRILSLYSACRNSVGSITASMDEILSIQDEAFQIIIDCDLFDKMDNEEDYEIANFSDLMGIMALAGLKPGNMDSVAVNLMWSKSFYAVLRNVAEFKTLFKEKKNRQHLVDCLSLFYLVEPLVQSIEDRKTLLINIMMWAVFDKKRDVAEGPTRSKRWQSSLQIAGQILWVVACLLDYDKWNEIDYKFLPLILIHNYCAMGMWSISCYNMSQWLASVLCLRSDRLINDGYIIDYMDRLGLSMSMEEKASLMSKREIVSKVAVMIACLERAIGDLDIGQGLRRRSREEAASVMYHLVSMIMRGHPFYLYSENELDASEVNVKLATEFRVKVDAGIINASDYADIIVELMQEAETGLSVMIETVPANESIVAILEILMLSRGNNQKDIGENPNEEALGVVALEGINQYQKQQDIIKKRINELACATSVTGARVDDSLEVSGIMTRLSSSYGAIATHDICQIGDQRLKTKLGFATIGRTETIGGTVTLGDSKIIGAVGIYANESPSPSVKQASVAHRIQILEGFNFDSYFRFRIDPIRIKETFERITSTKSAIRSDVNMALDYSEERNSSRLIAGSGITASRIINLVSGAEIAGDIATFCRIEEPSTSNQVIDRFKNMYNDIGRITGSDCLLFSKYYLFNELNAPLLIIILPTNCVMIATLAIVNISDAFWDLSVKIHSMIVSLQNNILSSRIITSLESLHFLSGITMGLAVYASCAWMFSTRTTLSSTLGGVIILMDTVKTLAKQYYTIGLLPIRAKLGSICEIVHEKTKINLMNKEEERGLINVRLINDKNKLQRSKTSEVALNIVTALVGAIVIPYRTVKLILRKIKKSIAVIYSKLVEKLKKNRSIVGDKIKEMRKKFAELMKERRINAEVNVDELKRHESPSSIDEERRRKGKAVVAENVGFHVENTGLIEKTTNYFGDKLANFGYAKIIDAVIKVKNKKETIMTPVPDEVEGSATEGLQSADIDIVTMHYLVDNSAVRTRIFEGFDGGCNNELGVSLVGSVYIVHKNHYNKGCDQGQGQMTMFKMYTLNNFFLDNILFNKIDTIALEYSVHNTLDIGQVKYNAKEYLSTGMSAGQKILIGRVTLITDCVDFQETVLTASHMVPYGSLYREDESFDGIDSLCCNWAIVEGCQREKDINVDQSGKDYRLNKSVAAIRSEKYIGSNDTDYVIFICKKGDYRGHSGGVIIDRRNRPIGICIKQITYNEDESHTDNKSLIIGCKLYNVDNRIVILDKSRVAKCLKCNKAPSAANKDTKMIIKITKNGVTMEDVRVSPKHASTNKQQAMEIVPIGTLERLCEINKSRDEFVFIKTMTTKMVVLKLMEELSYNKVNKNFGEPSTWLIRLVLDNMLESKTLLIVICSNMLHLSVCCLLTCLGVSFKRIRNLYSVERICKENVNNRNSEIAVITLDDLIIDLIKNKKVYRNSYRDRCVAYILTRSCIKDNEMDKVAVKLMTLVANKTIIKSWKIKKILNTDVAYKYVETKTVIHAQNAGHTKIVDVMSRGKMSWSEEMERTPNGRVTILTNSTTKKSQEMLAAIIIGSRRFLKNNVTIINFASLSADAVCQNLMQCDVLCISSWMSGEVTTGLFYNMQLDVMSDQLEIDMIEEAINHKLINEKLAEKKINLVLQVEEEQPVVASNRDKIMEIKMKETALPKIIFLEDIDQIVLNSSYSGRKAFKGNQGKEGEGTDEMTSLSADGEFNVDRNRILYEDFIKTDKERSKTITERAKDAIERITISIDKTILKISLKFKAVLRDFMERMRKIKGIIYKRCDKIKAIFQKLNVVKCSKEGSDNEQEFYNAKEAMSDSSSIDLEIVNDMERITIEDTESDSEEDDYPFSKNKRCKKRGQFSGSNVGNKNLCKRVFNCLKRKVEKSCIYVKRKIKGMLIRLLYIIRKPFVITGRAIASVFKFILKIVNTVIGNESNKIDCVNTYDIILESSKSIGVKIFRSLTVAISFIKLSKECRNEGLVQKMMAVCSFDFCTYELISSINYFIGEIYWFATSVPSVIVSATELVCQVFNKELAITVCDVSLNMGGKPFCLIIADAISIISEGVMSIKRNTKCVIIEAVNTGMVLENMKNKRSAVAVICEAMAKVFELAKRCLFKTRLTRTINKLWSLISNRNFDTKTATGVLKVVPCYIETERIAYGLGVAAMLISVIRLATVKAEEKLAMLGVITERKHLADNINLYLNDRTEYANLMRICCLGYSLTAIFKREKIQKFTSVAGAILICIDWLISDETYGGLGLSFAHALSRMVAADSTGVGIIAGLTAWWENGSTNRLTLNTVVLLGREQGERNRKNKKKERLNGAEKELISEQLNEREGNAALFNNNVSAIDALNECMKIIRKKPVSKWFQSKFDDVNKVDTHEKNALLNIDAVLANRKVEYADDKIVTVEGLYNNQCRYLGRLKELSGKEKRREDTDTSQKSVLMVANDIWRGVVDIETMEKWEAAGDSRFHVLIAIAERNDSSIALNVEKKIFSKFLAEMDTLIKKMIDDMGEMKIFLSISRINWLNVINIANEKSTPGILTRNRTGCKLTASYLPFYKSRIEAMREIIVNGDSNEENEIINVFAKRRIEKKKKSMLTGKEVVITRTIQANECDYKIAICDIFNVLDKVIKVTRSKTGISVGMNFFVEFACDDEMNKSLAINRAIARKMTAKRISLDHSSFDGSQRNWSIEAMKKFRTAMIENFFEEKRKKIAQKFMHDCYESLKCRVMITPQGDMFGVTGQQMSGHATTSVDNSVKAKCYCVILADSLKLNVKWEVINETIRVQGDDTKMEVLCPIDRADQNEMVKEIIQTTMSKIGQVVKKEKIEIFDSNAASNFLSHYTYDCVCTLRNRDKKKFAVLKLPGRNYFDNMNALATTLKAGKAKKYRKELGLLAAKAASFLTMYIGDIYLVSACCIILSYCLNEIKKMRKKVGKIIMAKEKLAYLLTSSDDIETVTVDIFSILKLHGVGLACTDYLFDAWIIGLAEEEKAKRESVTILARNIIMMLRDKTDLVLKNRIKDLVGAITLNEKDEIKEVRVTTLENLLNTGFEPIKLEIISKSVAYEPYLKFKEEVRNISQSTKEEKKVNYIITSQSITLNKSIDIAKKIFNIDECRDQSMKLELRKHINESGFAIINLNKENRIMESKDSIVWICESKLDAMMLGAKISNCLNIIDCEEIKVRKDRSERRKATNKKRLKAKDLNLLSSITFERIIKEGKLDRKNAINEIINVNNSRYNIIEQFRANMSSEFVNIFMT